jgi:hypothetical protein
VTFIVNERGRSGYLPEAVYPQYVVYHPKIGIKSELFVYEGVELNRYAVDSQAIALILS